jgi:hypothetical protein
MIYQEADVPDDLLVHVAPLGWEHIGLTGDHVWSEANPAASFRPLRDVRFGPWPLKVRFRTGRVVISKSWDPTVWCAC